MTTEQQLKYFREGFPLMKIDAPATPGKGINVLTPAQEDESIEYLGKAAVDGMVKFVPASGAASRMFKDIFGGLEQPNDAVRKLTENIKKFAFYDEDRFGSPSASSDADCTHTAAVLLKEPGLGYGSKPKGVLKFHRYPDEVRTALAEHLVEGQEYMRNADGTVNLTVTISPEHRELFESALAGIRDKYEKRYGVKYNIRFTYQSKETDTIAVTPDNEPFLCDDGKVLRRPAGHGALIYNLNEVEEELVSIKNIDNVAVESFLPVTARYKKVLMGCALKLRDRIFGFLDALDNASPDDAVSLVKKEILPFLHNELCVEIPEMPDGKLVGFVRAKLNRPVRVCGMVKNLGEPGGGPFVIREADGSTSLQILESVQINKDDPEAVAALNSATHFNPVDLVCCLKDYKGRKFNLPDYVDPDAGFISSKSFQGRELRALELPGLWNGSMSRWNTMFVEVPVETFNPVKVVLDLLRPAHQ
ncbi:MAG: DUF4301 family protein [Bacteroidales bacterium]|nr:DUF4301 family protein [Bacteroidales bacterium]